jgi:hypothetical protein
MKKNLIYFFLFLILISSVYSVSQESNNGITIINPKLDYIKTNTSFNLKFQVFDSNNTLLNNLSASCQLNFYNGRDSLLIQNSNLYFSNNEIDFYQNFSNGLNKGSYYYLVWCNSINEGGFISQSLEVTNNGEAPPKDLSPLVLLILFPFLFSLVIYFASVLWGEEHLILRSFFLFLIFVGFWASMQIALYVSLEYFNFELLEDNIALIININGWIFWLLIAYYALYIISQLKNIAFGKKQERRGFNDD